MKKYFKIFYILARREQERSSHNLVFPNHQVVRKYMKRLRKSFCCPNHNYPRTGFPLIKCMLEQATMIASLSRQP